MARLPLLPLDVPVPSAEALAGAAKEIGYVAIGFGVLGFQRAQVRRRELERSLRPVTQAAVSVLGGVADAVESAARSLPCRRGSQA